MRRGLLLEDYSGVWGSKAKAMEWYYRWGVWFEDEFGRELVLCFRGEEV